MTPAPFKADGTETASESAMATATARRGLLRPGRFAVVAAWTTLLLAVCGVGVAVYAGALRETYTVGLGCAGPASESLLRCDAIYLDAYSMIGGVRIAWAGAAGYALLACAAIWLLIGLQKLRAQAARANATALGPFTTTAPSDATANGIVDTTPPPPVPPSAATRPLGLVRLLVQGAVAATVALLTLQAIELGTFCPVCGVSAVTVGLLALVQMLLPTTTWLGNPPTRRALAQHAGMVTTFLLIGSFVPFLTHKALQDYDPREPYRLEAQAFLDSIPPPPPRSAPQMPRPGEAPWVVFLYRDGCPYCEQFFALHAPGFTDAMRARGFEIRKAELDAQSFYFNTVRVNTAPAVVIAIGPVGAGGADHGTPGVYTLVGYYRGEQLRDWADGIAARTLTPDNDPAR